MALFSLAYWGLAYTIGLVCVSGIGLMYIKERQKRDLRLFLFMSSMTFATLALSLRELLPADPRLSSWSGALGLLGAALCATTFPRFAASLEKVRFRDRISRLGEGLGLTLACFDLAVPLTPLRWLEPVSAGLSILALVVAVYFSLAWIYRVGRSEDKSKAHKTMDALIFLAFALFTALVVYLDFLGGSSRLHPELAGHFVLFPALYAFLSGFLIVSKLRVLGQRDEAMDEKERADGASIASRGKEALKRYGISDREAEVLALLAKGHTYREVADELFISPATVKSHVAHLFDKTGARNKVELINLTQ